jgi:hypothetical protein
MVSGGRAAMVAETSRKSSVRDGGRIWEGEVTALTAASLVRNGVGGGPIVLYYSVRRFSARCGRLVRHHATGGRSPAAWLQAEDEQQGVRLRSFGWQLHVGASLLLLTFIYVADDGLCDWRPVSISKLSVPDRDHERDDLN